MLDPQGRIVVVNQAWVRFAAEGQAGPYEVTVTPLADGDGAVVTHRPAPDPHGARSVR